MIGLVLDEYWKTIVSTIQDGLMIVDKRGRIVSVNKALTNMLGYRREELVGKTCNALNCDICGYAQEKCGDHWCILFRTGSIELKKCRIRKKNGETVHVIKNAALLRDSENKVIGAVETITDITELVQRDDKIQAYRNELRGENGFHGIIGISPSMKEVYDIIENAAHSDAPVIIFGESGTGKELVSQAIHEIGKRKEAPFVKVNCAALSGTLLESELFGHVKGAFTGAYRDREGRFETAQGGDMFLDEVGDLPLSTQVKLLRVLEEKVIERVGDNLPIKSDVRIISATNQNLKELVEKGEFREDFYFRINVIPITIPPLRERTEDIPLLAETFFRRIQLKQSGMVPTGISKETMQVLMSYSWPGNVRELKSAFEYAAVICHEELIQPWHLPPTIYREKERQSKEIVLTNDRKKEQLIAALKQADGNQSQAGRLLGVSRVTVWNRMKKYNISLNRLPQDS